MCGVIPMLASGKVKPRDVAAGAAGGLAGLALSAATRKKKPADTAEIFYGERGNG